MAHKRGIASENPLRGKHAPSHDEEDVVEIEIKHNDEIRLYELTDGVKERYEKMITRKLEKADAEWYGFHWEGTKLCVKAVAFVSIPARKYEEWRENRGKAMSNAGNNINAFDHLATQDDPNCNITVGPVEISDHIDIQERADKRPLHVEEMFVSPRLGDTEPTKVFSARDVSDDTTKNLDEIAEEIRSANRNT